MPEKTIGYVLLTVGVVIIIFSAISTYLVFTKKTQPVQLFNFSGISLDTAQLLQNSLPANAPDFLQGVPTKSTPTEIIPPELINSSSNLFAHLILMGFIATIGAKIATIGTLLVRPIVVKLKTKEEDKK